MMLKLTFRYYLTTSDQLEIQIKD